ncbi:MAG: hypothetical protein HQL98_00790 [Magnetococcales bacterium]|nr:hypothetical protein [Magnetococcales bacterium]
MKTIVACHHCKAKFKTLTDHVPAHGRPSPCPLCREPLVLWRADEYYPEHFSKELSFFLLHCKQATPARAVKTELEHLTALESWLRSHHKTLANATKPDLTLYLEEIRTGPSRQETDAIHDSLYRFYELLTQHEWIRANPLSALRASPPAPPPPLPKPEPASPSAPPPPQPRGNLRLVGLALGLGGMLAVAIHFLAPAWSPFFPPPSPSAPPGVKTEAARESALPAPTADPLGEETRRQQAEIDRWAEEVVRRAQYIREADRAILAIRRERDQEHKRQLEQEQEKERLKSREESQRATQTTKPKDPPKNHCLSGNCRDGTGHFRFDNGDEYQGNWRSGQRHGTGTYTYAKGEKYSGSWRLDQMEGQGTFYYKDGSRYEGEWRGNQRHGSGTLIQANGDKYVGEWRQDKRYGHGTRHLVFADHLARQQQAAELEEKRAEAEQQQARIAEEQRQSVEQARLQNKTGCVQGDCQNGQGVYIYPSGDHYSGAWSNGNRHGLGTYIFTSGDRYSGEWQHNQKHGQGSYRFQNGQQYDGGWQFNKKHGVGTITFANGLRLRGQWDNGQQIGQ